MAEGSKKRPAEDNTNTTPRKKLLNPLTWFSPNPAKDDDDVPHDSDDSDSDPVQLDQRTIANMIDADFAARQEKALVAEAQKNRKFLNFQLDITPHDATWIKKRQELKDLFATSSVLEVLKEHFTEGQQSLVEPPLYAGTGATLEIQKENQRAYKLALGEDGNFNGEKDNIITKFTMLHFGLPVGPLTLNNVLNTDKDENDADDDEPEPPRVQRIMFAEKPLEFLDKYYERGYGYPMLRLTGRRQPRPAPVQTSGTPVNMRGGAGKDEKNSHFLYSHYNKGRQIVETKKEKGHPVVIREDFRDAAQLLLQYDEDSDWEYVVDQYRNQEAHKNIAEKNFVRSFKVTKSTFDKVFDDYLKARVSNTLHDWGMVVRYDHTPSQAPATFRLPSTDAAGNPPAQYLKPASPVKQGSPKKKTPKENIPKSQPPKKSPTKVTKPSSDTNLGNGPDKIPELPVIATGRVYDAAGNYLDFNITNPQVPSRDFEAAAAKLLNAPVHPRLRIDFYSTQLGGPKKYDCFEIYPKGPGLNFWNRGIGPRILSKTGDLSAVIYECPTVPNPKMQYGVLIRLDVKPNLFWPPWCKTAQRPSAPPTPPPTMYKSKDRARIYGADNRAVSFRDKSNRNFLKAARTILGIGSSPTYSFCVELHSLQLGKVDSNGKPLTGYQFHHYVLIDDKDNLKQIFDHFLAIPLFDLGEEWFVRVVDAFELRPKPAPLPLPEKGTSTQVSPTEGTYESSPESSGHSGGAQTPEGSDHGHQESEDDEVSEQDQGHLVQPDPKQNEEDNEEEDESEVQREPMNQHTKPPISPHKLNTNQHGVKPDKPTPKTSTSKTTPDQPKKSLTSPKKPNTHQHGVKPDRPTSKITTPKTTPIQPLPTNGYVYGYAGKALVSNDVDSFKNAAVHLLKLDPSINWFLWVTSYKSDGTFEQTIPLLKCDFSRFFPAFANNRDSDGNWRVFFHKKEAGGPALFTDREPCSDCQDIVVIKHPVTNLEAYWRLPKDVSGVAYGTNQFQPGFFGAMQVHYPPYYPRPLSPVSLDGYPLGPGGMEAHETFLGHLRTDLENTTQERLMYPLDTDNRGQRIDPASIGIRMAGCYHDAYTARADYAHMEKEIKDLRDKYTRKPWPTHFKLYKTAEDRESGSKNFELIGFESATRVAEIKAFMEKDNRSTTCIWFCPVFPQITVKLVDSETNSKAKAKDLVVWDTQTCSDLASFKAVLVNLFKLTTPGASDAKHNAAAESFEIVGPDWDSNSRFVVEKATTDSQWRRDIFEWFQGYELHVQTNHGIPFVLDGGSQPWGIPENEDFAPRSVSPQPPTQPTSITSVPVMAPNAPKRNKERILKSRAAKPKPQKFDPWQAEQNRLDRLQRESYLKDQYAIQPGQKAEPPVYGKPRDLLLSVGSNLPEIYLRRLTATDIAQLEEENRRIRMRNLERQSACSMCNAVFPNYKPEDIAAHYREHANAIAAAGKCPMCATEGWVFMDMEHKKEHIMGHYKEEDSKRIREFFEGLDCPICGEGLQDMDPRVVVDHIAKHTPEVVRFCDICGMDLDVVNRTELIHHDETCREWDNDLGESSATVPIFCGQCGMDRTRPETDCERRAHGMICRDISCENCEKCGVDLTGFSDEDYATHGRRCMVPRGTRKTWCRKCGRDYRTMDAIGKAYHKNDCLLKPPASVTKDSRINDLQALIAKQRSQEAKNNSEMADLLDMRKKNEGDMAQLEMFKLAVTTQQKNCDTTKLKAAEKKLLDYEEESKKALGSCPFSNYQDTAIGKLSRDTLWAHLQFHASQAGTTAPKAKPVDSAALKGRLPWYTKESQRLAIAAEDCRQKMKAASVKVETTSLGGNSNNGSNNDTTQVTKLKADITQSTIDSNNLKDLIKTLKNDLSQAQRRTLTDAECDQKNDALQTTLNTAQSDLVILQAKQESLIAKVDCEGEKNALNDRITDLETQLAAAKKAATGGGNSPGNNPSPQGPPPPEGTTPGNDNPAPGPGGNSGNGNNNNNGGEGLDPGIFPTAHETNPQTGFLPSPPGGYRVRGSPKKSATSPRKCSGAAGSPSKKRKMHAAEEDDTYHPIPFLDVGTPAPVMPRSKKARTDAGGEEDYVIVGESMTSVPPRRSTRAASGTPAPSVGAGPSLVVKKGRGRPRKDVDDESPETVDEGEESDGVVITVKSSPRKGSRNSPAKRK
ncbi:uncharacterized protein PAC_16517 [Phialocephala subalpina]|uniref:Uncharacterized protein n=1 Tax=Phialocephala subalpina TaxID=576137 RepID=A0A1L7XNV3_9HELO|nr:uncharacterized protein PAC_16517 [Phialocephala subalpina]